MSRARPRSLADLPLWAREARTKSMPLDLSMMDAAVRLIADVPDDRAVLRHRRKTIGTGFLVAVPSEADKDIRYGYVVTAHHVIEDAANIEVQVPDPLNYGKFQPPRRVADWRQPLKDVDLVVAPFRGATEDRYGGLPIDEMFMPRTVVPHLAGTIHYIGTLEPINQPMARVASLGALYVDMDDLPGGYKYSAHLLDCRSYRGFSGSPCFAEYAMPTLTPIDLPEPFSLRPSDSGESRGSIEYHSAFCGMLTNHLEHPLDDQEREAVSRFGVGIMLPSAYVWAALYTEDMKLERLAYDEMNKTHDDKDTPRFRAVSAGRREEPNEEIDRFNKLLTEVVNTPKPDAEKPSNQ